MAASLIKHTNLTLAVTRLVLLEKHARCISTYGTKFAKAKSKPQKKKVASSQSLTTDDVQEISIPDRIERSPTAILEALASTVKNDVNQPMYVSIDDPALYSTSDRVKKQNLAAMDSGRKTAQLMLSEHPDYFTHFWDEPIPKAMKDPIAEYKYQEPNEEALLERVAMQKDKEAMNIYKAMQEANRTISQDGQEKLLELLTVTQSQSVKKESPLSVFVDQAQLSRHIPFPASTWKKGNMAEQVFNSLPEKTARAYCLMIRGMAANSEKEGAFNLYSEMKASKLPVDVYTYNKILSVVSLDSETMDDIAQTIRTILSDMAATNVRPNVETFNSILSNCVRLSRWTGAKQFALATLSEMKACGIEPALSTYVAIMNIFYYRNDKSPKTQNLFEEILDSLKDKEFHGTSERDFLFFRTAMSVVTTLLPDSKLALKVHDLVKTGKNFDLLGHRQLQFSYYKELLSTITPLEHIDVVMDIYHDIVPFIFMPLSELYMSILESIEMHDCYHYIPQLYADLQWTIYFKDSPFLTAFVRAMAKQKNEPQLQNQFCDIASQLLESWQKKRSFNDTIALSGHVVGDFILIHLNNDKLDTAWELFQLYRADKDLGRTDPSKESLTALADQLILAQDFTPSKEVLSLMLNLGYEGVPSLVEKAIQTFNLSDQERNYLQGLAADASSDSSSSDSSSSDSD